MCEGRKKREAAAAGASLHRRIQEKKGRAKPHASGGMERHHLTDEKSANSVSINKVKLEKSYRDKVGKTWLFLKSNEEMILT